VNDGDIEHSNEFGATLCESPRTPGRPWANALDRVRAVPRLRRAIRRLIYSTNSIASLRARFQRATRTRGHFSNKESARSVCNSSCGASTPTGPLQRAMDEPMKASPQRVRVTFARRLFRRSMTTANNHTVIPTVTLDLATCAVFDPFDGIFRAASWLCRFGGDTAGLESSANWFVALASSSASRLPTL
jgi:Transposase, Mutator family